MSVDRTDVPIPEPSPFSSTRYSNELNGAWMRYEVGVFLQEYVVWITVPHKSEEKSGLILFCERLKSPLKGPKNVVAKRGYPGVKFTSPFNNDINVRFQNKNRMRHKTVNQRFKSVFITANFFLSLVDHARNSLFCCRKRD